MLENLLCLVDELWTKMSNKQDYFHKKKFPSKYGDFVQIFFPKNAIMGPLHALFFYQVAKFHQIKNYFKNYFFKKNTSQNPVYNPNYLWFFFYKKRIILQLNYFMCNWKF